MVFRRTDRERELVQEEDANGLNIVSGDDDDEQPDEDEEEDEAADLFEEGQQCDVCAAEEGRVGLDPTCRGAYDGDPVLYGYNCLEKGLKDAYRPLEGVVGLEREGERRGAHILPGVSQDQANLVGGQAQGALQRDEVVLEEGGPRQVVACRVVEAQQPRLGPCLWARECASCSKCTIRRRKQALSIARYGRDEIDLPNKRGPTTTQG